MDEIKKILEQLGLLNQCQNEWKKWQDENQERRFFITKQTDCYCKVMDDEIKKLEKNRVMDKEYIRERISELTKVKNMMLDLRKDPDMRNPDIE